MLSISTGHDVAYLTGPVAQGREAYYTTATDTAGEPPGRWWGAGAAELGLTGEVDPDLLEAMFTNQLDPQDPRSHDRSTWGEADTLAGRQRGYQGPAALYQVRLAKEPDATPERREQLWAEAQSAARQGVAFIDATFSAQKSVSLLGAAFEHEANQAHRVGDIAAAAMWAERAGLVEQAVLVGATASLAYLEKHAGYSRAGHHGGGAGRWVDAHRFTVAQFLQHDSRNRDPQLHVHQAILNRVRCDDGTWRTVDAKALYQQRAAAAAVGERAMEAELSRTLGLRWVDRVDGHGREVAGVTQAEMDLFSGRRMAITEKAAQLLARFEARVGREASPLERTRIAQEATLVTRDAKSHDGETSEQRSDRWAEQCRSEVDGGLAAIAARAMATAAGGPDEWSVTDVVERAIATLDLQRQSWTEAEVMRAVGDALPANLGIAAADVPRLLQGLSAGVIEQTIRTSPDPTPDSEQPAELRRSDGSSQYLQPGAVRYSSAQQLAGEAAIRAAAVLRGYPMASAEQAERIITQLRESGRELGVDQAEAVRGILTSGAQVQVLLAAAGTGKSFVVGAVADGIAMTGSGVRVIGLAPSQIAANVLAENGLDSQNTTAWLQGTQRPDLQPRAGDLVVVDEAGMTNNPQILAIRERCAAAGANMLLVGDPKQLTSVGPGGALADLEQRGITHGLAEVRRFDQEWERGASLKLRDGDTAALEEYERHGRLVGAGTPEQAQAAAGRAWLADTLAGKESLLVVGSNEAAATLSAAMRAELVRLGRVEEQGVLLDRQGTVAGVGDLVQARHNGWNLVGTDGNEQAPLNRSTYRVTGLREDGGLIVAPVVGRDEQGGEELGQPLQLPHDYTARHVDLAYASTEHAAQGRTVDTGHDLTGGYVGMTRGRESNTAWLTTLPAGSEVPVGDAQNVEERTARAVMADRMAARQDELTALAEREQMALQARSTQTQVGQLVDGVSHVTAGRTAGMLDRLAAEGTLDEDTRASLAADTASGSLDRLLRTAELAGHDPEQVLRDAVAARDFEDVHSPAQTLHHRITTELHGQLTPSITSAHDLVPAATPPEWAGWLHARAEAADERRAELGTQTAEQAPAWATEALGPVPEGIVERLEWEDKAGWAAHSRELSGHDHENDPLGAAPPAGLVESSAIFRAAHEALDLPDATAEEADLSDGRLRVRVEAYTREEAWAPPYVGDALAAAHREAAARDTDATMYGANAGITADLLEREQLELAAVEARAAAEQARAAAQALEETDNARAQWYAETAATREAAERARVELGARGVDLAHPDDRTTAEEWLAAHAVDQAEAEAVVEVAEADVDDVDAPVIDVAPELDVEDWVTTPVEEQAGDEVANVYEEHLAAELDATDQPASADTLPVEDLVGDRDAEPVDIEDLYEDLAGPAVVDERAEREAVLADMPGDPMAAPAETNVPDVRDISTPAAGEHATDPPSRERVPRRDEVAEAAERAAVAEAEIRGRQEDEARRAIEEEARRAYQQQLEDGDEDEEADADEERSEQADDEAEV